MFFQQEKLPKSLAIPHKNIVIEDLKFTVDKYILAIENLKKIGQDLRRSRYAESNKYWLVTIYNELRKPKN